MKLNPNQNKFHEIRESSKNVKEYLESLSTRNEKQLHLNYCKGKEDLCHEYSIRIMISPVQVQEEYVKFVRRKEKFNGVFNIILIH